MPPEHPVIHPVFEPNTGTWQYVVADPSTSEAVIIDPVLDYDASTRTVSTHTANNLLTLIHSHSYTVNRILKTHAHADHLSAAAYLQSKLGAAQAHRNHRPPLICIGWRIGIVQTLFGQRYGVPADERAESAFDTLIDDDEQFVVGRALRVTALHLPGHTPDHLGYMFGGSHVFCGDSLFHPDIGSARRDFPGGSARDLYASARRLLALPAAVRIWPGHDYPPPPPPREPVSWATVADHRRENRHLRDGISEEEFVTMRGERDAGLCAPRLLHQALQMNIRAGRLPRPTPGFGDRLLHLPMRLGPGVGEW
ncbi:metallo-beta-lactamase superfamily protein [Lasiosphaeria miniovina]|uniref:Metallo-beta-lactamase superfamily protein n=1 Tax=Lasiosphaeria miniovina TaxID=1954250 RepID=A0AA40AJ80_9PEZI|nr:metallo-beta-lactamase superfamily protein [Lasiosphaeria miniovina]KAK0716848.1 metallo-beta-lactamase superfamily protein [Lasiosphaeria miniovina]